MRLFRTASAAVAAFTLVGAAASMAPASAATAGKGTAATTTQVLDAALGTGGSLLHLTLLDDSGRATIDPAVASPSSFSQLTAASLSSQILPSINVSVPATPFKASAPDGPATAGGPSVTLPTPSVVASGTVDAATLAASLADSVAKSSLSAGVSNLSAIGGLVSVGALGATLGTSSTPDASEATRSVNVTNIKVLDLNSLLQGLGIDLGHLSVAQIAGLVDSLAETTGLNLPSGQTTLVGAVNTLNGAISTLAASVDQNTGLVGTAVDSATTTLLGAIGFTSPIQVGVTTQQTVDAAILAVQTDLNALLVGGINNLITTPLLQLEGVQAGIDALAVDTAAASKATVTGTIGAVHIGGITVPGIDVLAAATQVTGLVTKVQDTLGTALSAVDPSLASMVKVSVLDKVSEVTESGGYVHSKAGITALTATITPPAALASLVQTINSTTTNVGSMLGAALPPLSTTMSSLTSTLGVTLGALSQGATVKAASVLGAADFTRPGVTPGAPATGTELPRTGAPTGLLFFGGLAAVAAFGIRRLFVHRAAVATVRTK